MLPQAEQVPGEEYTHGSRIKAYVVSVARTFRGPQVTVSRTHPNLVRKLFALEVPEIADGSVEIVAVAREAGHRSKIAVRTTVPGLNAKGACIGPMGQRVRNVMSELHGEKIDIVDWSDDPATFVAQALSPARVTSATVVDPQAKAVRVVVPDYQLSLAIGKEGQNARLAARLTGCRIDIRSDAQADDEAATPSPGVGRAPLRSGPPGRFGGRPARRRPPAPSPTRGTSRPRHALECRVAETSIPVRTCVGCRKRAPVSELLRVVVSSGALVPDPRRRLPGRGASVHPTPECLHAAERRRAFARALRLPGGGGAPLEAGPLRDHVLGASSGAGPGATGREPAKQRSSSRTGSRPVRTSTGHRRMSQP